MRAIRAAGWPDGRTPPRPMDSEQRIIDDIPLRSIELEDPWTAALVLGVRFNDVHDNAPTDVAGLVHIHNDPADQPAHCIRRAQDDGPAGDTAAMAACRDFILGEIELALGEGEAVDLDAIETVELFFAFSGATDVPLSRYAFHAGRALHALQDSYTHAFRDAATGEILHVTNWIDYARSSDYDEAVDGYRHLGQLDDCTRTSDASVRRVARATEASWQLLEAIANPAGGRAGRLSRARAVVDEALAVTDRTCTLDNGFCGAGELDEPELSCGVAPRGAGPAAAALVAVALAVALRRRAAAALALVGCFAAASPARAEPATGADAIEEAAVGTFGLHASVAASSDRGAVALTGGARWNSSARWAFGFDAEFNPWYSFDSGEWAPGLLNAYASAIYRHRDLGRWQLRTTVSAGTSVLLFDLIGVDKGSVGLYAGIAPLGVAVPIGAGAHLVIDPLSVSLPIPLVKGFPFFYRQYRVTAGIEWYL